jgi:hypothetical protein
MANEQGSNSARFVFRGDAVALGGRVIRIGDKNVGEAVPTPAASSLSIAGGSSLSKSPGSAPDHRFKGIFSWGECVAESIGTIGSNGSAKTTVTASIMKLSVTNKPITFQTDALKAVLESDHPTRGQPSMVPRDAIFFKKGMTLNKLPIELEIDLDLFKSFPTMAALDSEFKTNRKFYDRHVGRFKRTRGAPPSFGSPIPRVSGFASSSIVTGIKWGGRKIQGNVLTFEGFGSIYFGELLANENNRRLTLLRLEMGSDVSASMAFGEVSSNGSWD